MEECFYKNGGTEKEQRDQEDDTDRDGKQKDQIFIFADLGL